MSLISGMVDTGASFLLLFLMFRPLELCYPANANQRFFRPEWVTDLLYLVGQTLFFNGAVLWLLNRMQPWLQGVTPPIVRVSVSHLPWWEQAALIVIVGDVLIYWGHRLQHRVGFLWRFHAIHHSAKHLDWLAAHREHPIDSLYTIAIVNAPLFALGVPVRYLAAFAGFRGLWAVFIHSNVRLPIGPMRLLIGAPELHHWHHDRSREAGNYANVSPLMDIVFGTYRCPDHEPEQFGIEEPMPGGYFAQLLHPFRGRAVEAGDEVTTKPDARERDLRHVRAVY